MHLDAVCGDFWGEKEAEEMLQWKKEDSLWFKKLEKKRMLVLVSFFPFGLDH